MLDSCHETRVMIRYYDIALNGFLQIFQKIYYNSNKKEKFHSARYMPRSMVVFNAFLTVNIFQKKTEHFFMK